MDKSILKRNLQGLLGHVISMNEENEEEQVKKLKEAIMDIYNSL